MLPNTYIFEISQLSVLFQQYLLDRYGQELLKQQTHQTLQMPPPPQAPPLNPERAILIQRVPHRARKGGKNNH